MAITPQQFKDRVRSLPFELQGALFDNDLGQKMASVGLQNNIPEEKIADFGEEATWVLVGLKLPSDLAKNLEIRLAITSATAEKICKELYEDVYKPLELHLRALHNLGNLPFYASMTESSPKEKIGAFAPERKPLTGFMGPYMQEKEGASQMSSPSETAPLPISNSKGLFSAPATKSDLGSKILPVMHQNILPNILQNAIPAPTPRKNIMPSIVEQKLKAPTLGGLASKSDQGPNKATHIPTSHLEAKPPNSKQLKPPVLQVPEIPIKKEYTKDPYREPPK